MNGNYLNNGGRFNSITTVRKLPAYMTEIPLRKGVK
jgi:hypothetical protein